MKAYKEIDLIQGSSEWKEYRRSHIMASDSSKLTGHNKYSNPLDCYNDKIEGKEIFINAAMQRGIDLEPIARSFLEKKYGIALAPKVFESIKYPWMGASLDAISNDHKTMIEIKCTGEKNMARAFHNDIDEMYIYQCQKQMLVMGLHSMKLFYYYDEYLNIIHEIDRDEKKIQEIIKAETDFWHNHLLPKIPPEKISNDYARILCPDANALALLRNTLHIQEKALKAEREEVEAKLSAIAGGKNSLFVESGLKIQVVERKGSIDWKSLSKTWSITVEEQEKYRKENSSYSKFTIT